MRTYGLRWKVELSFKRLKSEMNMTYTHSKTLKGLVQETEARILFDTVSLFHKNDAGDYRHAAENVRTLTALATKFIAKCLPYRRFVRVIVYSFSDAGISDSSLEHLMYSRTPHGTPKNRKDRSVFIK